MKFAFVLSLLLAVSPVVFGQSDKSPVHKASGVVTRVDKDKVSIRHDPVPSLNWPSMTMAFKVKDKALMDKMKKGEKVDFDFVQEGRDYVVTAVK